MKIFKNRGDIYIPKSSRATNQAKVLFVLLAFIVVFTVAFVIYLSQHYDSAADFFARGEVTVTQQENSDTVALPEIEGKVNYLVLETDDNEEIIHYLFLLQADKNNKAYKVGALSPAMKIGEKSLQDIFTEGGGAALQTTLMEYFAFPLDYYAQFDSGSMVEFLNKLGTFVYMSEEDIDFSGGGEDDKYTLRINQGEQRIGGRETANLMRYFSEEKKNFSLENEFALRAVTSLFNADNYENVDALFRLFMKCAKTDITVREFENNKDAIMVFCLSSTDITLYSCRAEYDENSVMSPSSVKNFKGYFNEE